MLPNINRIQYQQSSGKKNNEVASFDKNGLFIHKLETPKISQTTKVMSRDESTEQLSSPLFGKASSKAVEVMIKNQKAQKKQ